MAVYYGVVKGSVVELPEGAYLPEGATVEVRVISPPRTPEEEAALEDLFEQRLLELGLLSEIKRPPPRLDREEHPPVKVKGKPLSEMIIEERR